MKITNRGIVFFLLLSVIQLHGTALIPIDSADFGDLALSVAWLQSGGTTYLAVGGQNSAKEVIVYSFDGATLTPITTADFGLGVRSVAWLQSGGVDYLAVGGDNGANDVIVYRLCQDPVANNDMVIISPDTTVIDVLANDMVECASLVDVLITNPANGTAQVNQADGTITYTPDENFLGIDSFTYEICDESNQCSQATVDIGVVVIPTDLLSRAIQDKYFKFCFD